MKISILNSNINNLKSIVKIVEFYDHDSLVVDNASDILLADKLIIPGISSFNHLIDFINSNKLLESLKEQILIKRIPILAICAGLQILTKFSEEGGASGLGIIDGTCKLLPSNKNNLIPHHGWNYLYSDKDDIKLDYKSRYYFSHSYYLSISDIKIADKWCFYNISFPAIIKQDNIIGTQFHPEKSLDAGMELVNNFCSL